VEGLTVVLNGRRVLDEVTLSVGCGEFLCLLGPNGGGKTTFLKAVLGLVPVAAGTVEVLGRPAGRGGRAVGYLPQSKSFHREFPATAVELIVANLTGRWPARIGARERETARAALARAGGEHLLDAPLARLSGGETQRVFLARALVTEPGLLLLDEPTAGVDRRGRAEFLDLLAGIAERDDLAAVLVTHSEAAVRRLAERVAYLDRTLVAWGPPASVLEEDALGRGAFAQHDHDGVAACEE
jgi:ABC-type Mn2+/Zn2+ transport system ATPase subunit